MYGRQFATMTVMVLLSFLMLGASFATLSYQYTIQEKRDAMSRSANIIASYTSSYINANGEYSWQEKDLQAQLNVLALVTTRLYPLWWKDPSPGLPTWAGCMRGPAIW